MSFNLADVLKDVSNLDTGREQIEYISRELIDSDTNNFYSLDGLDTLADNIATVGLQQPIRVRKQEDGRYIAISGHRRRAAVDILAKDDPERWAQIPCIVESAAASPAMQQLALIYANSATRQLSGVELSKQAEQVEKLLYQLKEEGHDFPGRMRDHVAEAVNASKSKLARLKVIRSKLIPQFMRLWEKGDLRESVAYTLAGAAPVRQKAIWVAQTDDGKKPFRCTDGWVADILRQMTNAEKVCKNMACSVNHTSSCDHVHVRLNRIASSRMYDYLFCVGCCLGCHNLASCKFSCENAADAKKVLEDKAREDAKQAKAAQREKEQQERDILALAYSRVKQLREDRGISAEDFTKASMGYAYYSSMSRLPGLEDGSDVKLTDCMPGGIWAREALALIRTADLLGCSIDYLLGRDVPAEPSKNVSKLDTGWNTGDPEAPGFYPAFIMFDAGVLPVCELIEWDGEGWIVSGYYASDVDATILAWSQGPSWKGDRDGAEG